MIGSSYIGNAGWQEDLQCVVHADGNKRLRRPLKSSQVGYYMPSFEGWGLRPLQMAGVKPFSPTCSFSSPSVAV